MHFKIYKVKDFSQICEESILSIFNFKKHVQNAFFTIIKFDHRIAFCDKKVFSFLLKICLHGHKNIRLSKLYPKEKKPFYKILKNSQVEAEKLRKTADFVISLIFPTFMLLEHMFLNIFTKPFAALNYALRLFWYPYRHILQKLKNSRLSVLMLSKNAFIKCCLKLKNTVVFTTWFVFMKMLRSKCIYLFFAMKS